MTSRPRPHGPTETPGPSFAEHSPIENSDRQPESRISASITFSVFQSSLRDFSVVPANPLRPGLSSAVPTGLDFKLVQQILKIDNKKRAASFGGSPHGKIEKSTSGAKALICLVVRTGMSVTEGTGHVGNTFVEVEVKRAWGKRKPKSSPEAVGMWEARRFCELSKAVLGREGKSFCFSSLSTPPSFP
jgi:hypothetical protein